MGPEVERRSDRIYLELGIEISGVDAAGKSFSEPTQTLVVSRHGAKILSGRMLLPQQPLSLRCLKTGIETTTRVVGQIGRVDEGYYYGLEVADSHMNIWAIEFPAAGEGQDAAGRVLLECIRCHTQEVAHLDVFALEVLLANQNLMRPCRHCIGGGNSLWKQAALREAKEGVGGEVTLLPLRTNNERRDARIGLEVDVCVRHREFGEEIASTENISRGGFRFKSRRRYPSGTVVEAALPYTPGAANIFAPAKIVYADEQPTDELYSHGVAYIVGEMATSLTGLRIERPL
jgi:PilZ domain